MVSTWPRLSQTFVLNEILALEREGLRLRIFSIKNPSGEPIHTKVAQVRAPVHYLSYRFSWRALLRANVRLAWDRPGRYFRIFLRALRYGRLSVLRRFFQAGYLAVLLRTDPVAHLHAHFATAPALVAMLTHELVGIPYSFTAHARDIYVDTPPELLRAEMEGARAVITVSGYNRRHLLAQLAPDSHRKVRCIYNGLDLSDFSFQWPRPRKPGPPLILCVARLVEKKGLGDLIAAAGILRRQGHYFRIEILGEGPLQPALESQSKELGLRDRVSLLGAQPQEMVRLAYQRASIFALPCVVAADGDRDGIPTVLLEAMASGIPVVSTSVAGIPELVDSERDGLVVAPNDCLALAHALGRLLVNPGLRDRLAQAARAKIEECFAIERSAEQLLAVFLPAQRGDALCLPS